MPKSAFRPRLFSTDQYSITLPAGHKFPINKYGMLRGLVEKEGLFQLERSPLADSETVCLAHDPDYVTQFTLGTLSTAAMRRIGLPWSETFVQRAYASVGGTISASLQAWNMAGEPPSAAARTMLFALKALVSASLMTLRLPSSSCEKEISSAEPL